MLPSTTSSNDPLGAALWAAARLPNLVCEISQLEQAGGPLVKDAIRQVRREADEAVQALQETDPVVQLRRIHGVLAAIAHLLSIIDEPRQEQTGLPAP